MSIVDFFFGGNFVVLVLTVLLVIGLAAMAKVVPQNQAYVIERFGRYHKTLSAGLNFILPFIDKVAYQHSLKEIAIDVASQNAITLDNVSVQIDGILYLKIMDPRNASYGIEDLFFAVSQLAQTTMRAEIGKMSLDETFESRDRLNASITTVLDEAANPWGTKVLRYEVSNITPPQTILDEMEKQMSAERERRVAVTTSEGYRQSQINQAEGDKQAAILRAEGEAQSIRIEADARASAIRSIAQAIEARGGSSAVSQQLAEQYIVAFDKLARHGTIALLPGDATDIASMVGKAFTAFDTLSGRTSEVPSGSVSGAVRSSRMPRSGRASAKQG